MLIRSIIYLITTLFLVVLVSIANTRLGWSVDLAWMIVVALVFAYPPELAPIAGLTFGLILDGLTGSIGFYTIAYGGFGAFLMFLKRVFYLDGFIPAWIVAVVGCEVFWLVIVLFSRAVNMIGGATRSVGLLSPFILTTLILFPVVFWITNRILSRQSESRRGYHYGTTRRIIDRL